MAREAFALRRIKIANLEFFNPLLASRQLRFSSAFRPMLSHRQLVLRPETLAQLAVVVLRLRTYNQASAATTAIA